MPTGYTSILHEDRPVAFNEFAWRCARAFGAFVMMRDDGLDVPVPSKMVPSDYHEKRITEARAALSEARAMIPSVAFERADESYRKALASYESAKAERAKLRERYLAMRAEAEAWQPPTPEHEGLRRFMIEQIDACAVDYQESDWDKPPLRLSGEDYKHELENRALRELAYHTKALADERKGCDQRNTWIDALRSSVGPPPNQGGPLQR
jgi:hypothetical protein